MYCGFAWIFCSNNFLGTSRLTGTMSGSFWHIITLLGLNFFLSVPQCVIMRFTSSLKVVKSTLYSSFWFIYSSKRFNCAILCTEPLLVAQRAWIEYLYSLQNSESLLISPQSSSYYQFPKWSMLIHRPLPLALAVLRHSLYKRIPRHCARNVYACRSMSVHLPSTRNSRCVVYSWINLSLSFLT